MATIIGIYNNKGGFGKTTISFNLAGVFAVMGLKVLLVDIYSIPLSQVLMNL